MLTATYSLIAMEAEQTNAIHFIANTRQSIAALCGDIHDIGVEQVQLALAGVTKLDDYFHQRKLEKYVIPAVRGSSQEIDTIVSDLDALTGSSMALLNIAIEHMRASLERQASQLLHLFDAMNAYCECLHVRLQREEKELLPLVQRVFSMEDWFALAAQFLGDKKERGSASREATPSA